MYDVAVIGAGIIGVSIARALAQCTLTVIVIEKDNDVANEATMANSGIIYNGYNAKQDKLKGAFTFRGNLLYEELCRELDVPFKRAGMVVAAFEEEGMEKVRELFKKAVQNGTPHSCLLTPEEVMAIEPNISKNVAGAFYSPECGIVSPWELTFALAENAIENGVEFRLGAEVTDVMKTNDTFRIIANQKEIQASCVINCAGMYADKINNMVDEPQFKIKPKKGQYFVLDKRADQFVNNIVSRQKTETEKGFMMIPTVDGNLLIGPLNDDAEDKESKKTSLETLHKLKRLAASTFDNLPLGQVIRSFSGLKAKADVEDFFIQESKQAPGFINVAGINSPGLTCAPAIAEHVREMVKTVFVNRGVAVAANKDFNPVRKKGVSFRALPLAEQNKLIAANPQYGSIVCRCEMVTEGEIVEAIHRKPGATTVKGVKKRTRAGMGRCQGGFCSSRVVRILARELQVSLENVVYDEKNSYIVAKRVE